MIVDNDMKKLNKSDPKSPKKSIKITRCKLTKKHQLRMIEFFVLGVTARSAAELMGVQPNTAALFYRKVRQVLSEQLSMEAKMLFNGEIVIDQSYLTPPQPEKKEPVFGIISKNGRVFTKMTSEEDKTASDNATIIAPNSMVFSEVKNIEQTLDVNECLHQKISISAEQEASVIERFWNQTKATLRKYNGIPKSNFSLFIKECEFRFNYPTHEEQLKTLKAWTGLKS
jgi:transposase